MIFKASWPLIIAILDETAARSQFPVLSDFETPFEIDRWWAGNADFSIDNKMHYHGKASLKVILSTSHHSGVSLIYLPGNWMHYKELQLSIYNPDEKPIELTCHIPDRQNRRSINTYDDGFYKSFSISNGWNLIRIPLIQIANTPLKPKIALDQIRLLWIFAVSLPEPRTIYIDYVRLVNY